MRLNSCQALELAQRRIKPVWRLSLRMAVSARAYVRGKSPGPALVKKMFN